MMKENKHYKLTKGDKMSYTLISCKTVVTNLLTHFPELRDNDIKLIQEVWKRQSGVIDLLSQPVGFLFDLMKERKLSDGGSIRRMRRQLQQSNPHLRGEKYDQRHNHQKKVINDINTIKAESMDPTYWRDK